MKNNNQAIDTDTQNDFNNIESVESVYPADAIDIIDNTNSQVISNYSENPSSEKNAANDEQVSGEIYSLDNARLAKQSKSIERRACKSRLTDRRSAARLTASGEVQQDRRKANRIANVESIRLAQSDK